MDTRRSPDRILQGLQEAKKRQGRGSLKIFFGYAAGVGKTYAMLEAAHEQLRHGADVVAGYIEPHARPDTAALAQGIESLPCMECPYKGMVLHEFNLDAALQRKPQLILVDELAHTNANGCRHEKRYQDIQELLQAGIDVYTTVNVQHIESLNDIVASITAITVQERIPDSFFDDADQVELVDIEPADLKRRLQEGKIYDSQQARSALRHFFTTENLTALREIALRRMADRVNRRAAQEGENDGKYPTQEHILVCLSSSPSNPKIIRTAARMAHAFNARFTALFVRTSACDAMTEDDKRRLERNTRLAEQLGASVETVTGEKIPFQIAEFARMARVSQLVVGRSNTRSGPFHLLKRPFTDQLLAYLPSLDIHVIPDYHTPVLRASWLRAGRQSRSFSAKNTAATALLFAVITAVSLLMNAVGVNAAAIIPLYIIGALCAALYTADRLHSIALTIANLLAFDFLFIAPKHTLAAYDPSYEFSFAVVFLAAALSGELAGKVKTQAAQSAQQAHRMRLLLETNQALQQAETPADVERSMVRQLGKLVDRDIVYYPADMTQPAAPLLPPQVYWLPGKERQDISLVSPNEQAVAAWTYKNKQRAGALTETLREAQCLYMPVRSRDAVYGVAAIAVQGCRMDTADIQLVQSILTEGALALEKEWSRKRQLAIQTQARNEELRANLLRSISHDLRTPLTSISGNADMLLHNEDSLTRGQKNAIYTSIYDDAMWLIHLVENILSITRMENGAITLRRHDEVLDDMVCEALRHVNTRRKQHMIHFAPPGDIVVVHVDAHLIVQVLVNLLDNAIKYTPEQADISIRISPRGADVDLLVADSGPGIAEEDKEHIFTMFYTGKKNRADSGRSLGLGLMLCRSIMEAHGGSITVRDNVPHGAVFVCTLPIQKVIPNE